MVCYLLQQSINSEARFFLFFLEKLNYRINDFILRNFSLKLIIYRGLHPLLGVKSSNKAKIKKQ
jgi:hypothetical protein